MNGEVLANIPRWLTGLADWLACMLYLTHVPRRLHGAKFWAVSALFLPLIVGFLHFTADHDGALFNLFMFLSVLIMLLFILIAQDGSFFYGVYLACRAFILGGLFCSLAWQLYTFFLPQWTALQHTGSAMLFLFAVLALQFLFILLIEGKKNKEALPVSLQETASTIILTLAIYILSSISYAPLVTPFGSASEFEAFNIRTIVYAGGVAILYAYNLQLREFYYRFEVEALKNMLHMQYNNYRANRESIELVNQKYHDLKHQIMILRSMSDSAQTQEYLTQMEDEIRSFEAQNKTGNEVLDTVLTGKSLQCQKMGITLTCVADGEALNFLSTMDISTLFGNALDNATESVRKLPEEKRVIHLSVVKEHSFLRIRVENCYAGELHFSGGLLPTTKGDTKMHGYGLKSIRNTAKKYGGSLTIHAENGWFELRILIPIP